MKLNSPWLEQLLGIAGAKGMRALMRSLEVKVGYYDPLLDPPFPGSNQRRRLYLFWHEYIIMLASTRGHCELTMLLSQHRDANVMNWAAWYLGFGVVRGSTKRGGVAALKQLIKVSRSQHLTMTPDGPRGPRRKMAPGPIFLASKLQMPIICVGCGFERPWRMNSWDRFAVPKPGTRGRFIVGPEFEVPRNLDRDGLEYYRRAAESQLNQLTDEAEDWAATGATYRNEAPVLFSRVPAWLTREEPELKELKRPAEGSFAA